MCGFVGFADRARFSPPDDIEGIADRCAETLRHRGPDFQQAKRIHSQVIFGHTRLSIIDLGPGGHQPMLSSDGRHVIVLNGEIYNYRLLKREL